MGQRAFPAIAAIDQVLECIANTLNARESDVTLVTLQDTGGGTCGCAAYRRQNMWTRSARTLARESRHIVGFRSVGTISRCGGQAPEFSQLWIAYPTAASCCRRREADSAGNVRSPASADTKDRANEMWTDERVELLKKLWTEGLSA